MDKEDLPEELQPFSQDEQAKLLEEERCGLKWCLLHQFVIYWDGPANACPVCRVIREQREEAAAEFLALTKDME